VLNSDENQTWRHKFGLQKDKLYQEFLLAPHPSVVNAIQLFFLPFSPCKSIMKLILTSLHTPINDAQYKARLLCTGRSFAGKQIDS
jgi:hypothetical protein